MNQAQENYLKIYCEKNHCSKSIALQHALVKEVMAQMEKSSSGASTTEYIKPQYSC